MTLYDWMDVLNGYDLLSRELFLTPKNTNLEKSKINGI
jgi:hypothetical protein